MVDKIWSWVKANHGFVLNAALLAVVYIVAAKLGLSLAYTTRQITTVWPPTGIALVALLVMGWRYWPGVAAGAFIANLLTNEPVLVAAGIAVGNTLEALAGAGLLKRLGRFRNVMETPRDALWLTVAVLVAVLVAATIGTLSLGLGGLIAWHAFWSNWLVWWAGDAMGGLLIGPLLLVYLDRRLYSPVRARGLEAGVLLAAVFGVSMLVFASQGQYSLLHYYLIFPFMVWAALRFWQVGVVTTSLVVAGTAVWATVNNLGPLAQMPVEPALIQLLVIVIVVSETSLLLAMAIRDRAMAAAALHEQTKKLEQLEVQLREANRRMTDILASVLDDGANRHDAVKWRPSDRN